MISYRFSIFSYGMTKKGNDILLHLEILENELLYRSRLGKQSLFWEMTDFLITDRDEDKV